MSQPSWPPPTPGPQQWPAGQAPPPPSGDGASSTYAEHAARLSHPHEVPRLYPQMLRTWTYAWWKPLVGILAAAVLVFAAQVLLLGVLAVGVALEGGPGSYADRFAETTTFETVTPSVMLYTNLGLASLTLIAWLIVRVVHGMRPRWLASVLPGIRWKFLFGCFGLAVIALIASFVVGALLPGDSDGVSGSAHVPTGRLLASAIVIVLTTPLQALGEEYGFRGYLMQAFGSLGDGIASAWGASRRTAELIGCGVALVLTSTLFALAHGLQNFPLFFDRFTFGLMAGLVVILVGGLEAGIALHVLNNLLAFGVAIAYDQMDSTLNVSEASWWQVPVTVVQNGVFLLLVLWLARRMGLSRRSTPAGPTTPAAEPGRFAGQQPVV